MSLRELIVALLRKRKKLKEGQLKPLPKHTEKRKTRTLQEHDSKVKNSSYQECGKRKNHCTSLKLRSKNQNMKVVVEREGS